MRRREELCRLLEERGIGYRAMGGRVEWRFDGIEYVATIVWPGNDPDKAKLIIHATVLPEQAVEISTGVGTTHVDETDTWEVVRDDLGGYGKRMTVHVMECSKCGHTYEHVNGDYEYCPHCRRRIIEERDEA